MNKLNCQIDEVISPDNTAHGGAQTRILISQLKVLDSFSSASAARGLKEGVLSDHGRF